YYEAILPIIMYKIRRDKRKEVHARLDFGEGHRERRIREGSHYLSARTPSARPDRTSFRDRSRGRSLPHRRDSSSGDRPERRDYICGFGESYDKSHSSYEMRINHEYRYRDKDRSRHTKRGRDSESLLSRVSKSDSKLDPFTPRIRNFKSSRKTRMPNNVKTYDETGDPEDHVKIFQAEAQVERWAMPTWCHMFNSTLIGAARVWFDELPPESIDGYKDLKAAFLAYFMQQKKYVKDPVEIHNIKQKDGETIKDFMERVWFDELPPESIDGYKDLKAAFLAYFMQQKKYVKDPVEIHNIKQKDGETIKDFMERFKVETGRMKGAPKCMRISGFMHGVNNPKLTKSLNEHVPKTMEEMMITTNAFIRGEAAVASKKKCHTSWRTQDQSKRQTSEKRSDFRGKLSHLVKEIKHGRDQSKVGKKKAPSKDKLTKIYMIQSWQRKTRQKVTQIFERVKEITFPSLAASSGKEGPLVIEAEIDGHIIHHMYVDGGSSTEVLYEHCFNRLRPKVKNKMVSATTSLIGFSRETIWPLGQLRLMVTIGDADHSTRAWMNFIIVRSLSLYNGIIGRPEIKEIQAVPSTAHKMLKFPADRGIVTICSTILIPAEYATVITSSKEIPKRGCVRHENFKVALQGPELNYTPMEKLVLSLVFTAKRLQSVMLGEHNITYRPRTSMKEQVLADFLAEMLDESPPDASVVKTQQEPWTLFTDGSSCVDGRSFLTPWLRYVRSLQADYVIREIHEGSCSMHARPRSLVAKAIWLGYYWPTMHRDARNMIRTCNDSQIHRPVTRNLQQPLTSITAPWPFYKWGIDIAGPFSEGPAIIPVEIGMPTYRTAAVDVVHNDEDLRLNLDLLEERRERATIREAKAKLKMTKYYNVRVRGVTFRPGDFVYRSNDASHAVDGGKLGPKWEGPYEVTKALGDAAYKLRSADGTVLLRTWNFANLKKCYL
nr:reverse transcriptase domain-containing protein [Tanacetum cinerariifolium]